MDEKYFEKIIEERIKYEEEFLEDIIDDKINTQYFDEMIDSRIEEFNNFYEESPELERLDRLYYQQREIENSPADETDYIDNYHTYEDVILEGQYEYYERQQELLEQQHLEEIESYQIEAEYEKQLINDYEEYIKSRVVKEYEEYDEIFEEYIEEDFEKLIEEHLKEENYFKNIVEDFIEQEHYYQKAIDKMISNHYNIEYEEEYFDYDENDLYPIKSEVVKEKDPFDSLGDIDYPEGYNDIDPMFEEVRNEWENFVDDYIPPIIEEYEEPSYEEILEEEYLKSIPEPPEDIEEYDREDMVLEFLIKRSLKQDKYLENLINKKLAKEDLLKDKFN